MNIEEQRELLKKAFQDSIIALDEARVGRQVSDIPRNDPYWLAVNKHRAVHRILIKFNETH